MLTLLAAMLFTEPPEMQPAFKPMAFLVGHCWEGRFDNGQVDTHCYDSVYDGQHIRDRHAVTGGKSVYRGETIYSRDGKTVSFTYWNSSGGVSRGSMTAKGDTLNFGIERHRTRDGKDIAIATLWRRVGADAYEAVTSSAQLPSMNRTVVYRRLDKAISARVERAPDGTQTLVHTAIVDASPPEAWAAITTAEGWRSWAVPVAWLDGESLETSYSATATRGDESSIRQQIVRREPERLMEFRTVKAPKGFPYFDSFRRVTHRIELQPLPDGRTRVRLTGTGYPDDEAGLRLVTFFTEGNRVSLERLRRRFAEGPIDWAKEQGTAAK